MATYVNDLRLKEIGTGESSGTWGTETNTNLELIGEALGYATEGITTNADTHATTVADGSTDPGRAMYIKYTGTLDSACTITIGPNTMSRVHIIENATSGSQNIIIKQGSGSEITIPNGYVKVVYLDGAGSGAAVTEAFADLSIGPNLRIGNAAAEDTSVVFDGNAKDFYIGLDDSADKLVIGEGSTVGTNNILTITDDTVTIGDGAAADTAIVFDGNAQDFYIGLDDSADDLIIGLGSTVGTTPIISVDENKDVAIPDGSLTITTNDNNAQLIIVSTDADASTGPQLDLTRNSGSPADSDTLGRIRFNGMDDGGNELSYGHMTYSIVDASDGSEDGKFEIDVRLAGTNRSRMLMSATETVFNNEQVDLDFRVEGSNDSHALFVNAGADVVSFGGMQSDVRYFSGLIPKLQADATTRMDASIGLTCNSNDTLSPMIMFGKTRGAALDGTTVAAAGDAIGSIVFNPSDGTANLNAMGHTAAAIDAVVESGIGTNDVPAALRFYTNPGGESSSERMRIDSSGNVLVGTTTSLGSISNGKRVTGGIFNTFADTVGAANNTATTMVSLSTAFATYIVCAGFNGVGNTNLYGASAIIHSDGTSHTMTQLVNPSNMTLSMSGSNVQATQTSGATLNISFSCIRIQ